MMNLDGWMTGRMDGKDDWTPPQEDKTKDIIYEDYIIFIKYFILNITKTWTLKIHILLRFC